MPSETAYLIPPLVETPWGRIAVVLGAYVLTLALSGVLVRLIVTPAVAADGETAAGPKRRLSPGTVIGKCENIITVTLVLANQATGLAVIFAAKSLVRQEEIRRDAAYFLGGTLVNFSWGLLVASIARIAIFGVAG